MNIDHHYASMLPIAVRRAEDAGAVATTPPSFIGVEHLFAKSKKHYALHDGLTSTSYITYGWLIMNPHTYGTSIEAESNKLSLVFCQNEPKVVA